MPGEKPASRLEQRIVKDLQIFPESRIRNIGHVGHVERRMLPNAVMYRGPEAQEKGAQRLRLVGIDVGWAGSTCPSTAPLVADNFGNVSLQNPGPRLRSGYIGATVGGDKKGLLTEAFNISGWGSEI